MPKQIREVYGSVLAELGETNENIVVLDADLSGSTKSAIFGKAHPERFFNMGIAEQNMVATAAGMAACGKIPFVNTFTVFLTSLGLLSARDQICYKYAVENYGPMYLRLSREVYPDLYTEDTRFELGKGAIVRDGSDVTVIACGIMVHKALEAAKILEERLISVRVVDMYSIKPIDRELIVKCAEETGAIVCAEEHNIHGGLGSAVSEVLAYEGCGVPTEFVGIQDTFTESAPYKELLAKYGLDADGVIEGIEKVLDRK